MLSLLRPFTLLKHIACESSKRLIDTSAAPTGTTDSRLSQTWKRLKQCQNSKKHLAIGPSFLSKPHLGDKRGGFTWAIGLHWSTLVCRCLATLQLKMHLEDESQLLLVKLTQKATKNNTRINKKEVWLIDWYDFHDFSSLEHVQHGDFYIAGVAGLVLLYGLRDLGVTEIPTHMNSFSSQPK